MKPARPYYFRASLRWITALLVMKLLCGPSYAQRPITCMAVDEDAVAVAAAAECSEDSLKTKQGDDDGVKALRKCILDQALLFKDSSRWPGLHWSTNLEVCLLPSVTNAYAQHRTYRIMLGLPLLQDVQSIGDGLGDTVGARRILRDRCAEAVLYHEFAHHFQFKVLHKWYPQDYEEGPNLTLRQELEADAIAAALLKVKDLGDEGEFRAIRQAFGSLGSSRFNRPRFHGTSDDRKAAATIGMYSVEAFKTLKSNAVSAIHHRIFTEFPKPFIDITAQEVTNRTERALSITSGLLVTIEQSSYLDFTDAVKKDFGYLGAPVSEKFAVRPVLAGIDSYEGAQQLLFAGREFNAAQNLWAAADADPGGTNDIDYPALITKHLTAATNAILRVQSLSTTNSAFEPRWVSVFGPSQLLIGKPGQFTGFKTLPLSKDLNLWVQASVSNLNCSVTYSRRGPTDELLWKMPLAEGEEGEVAWEDFVYRFTIEVIATNSGWVMISAEKRAAPERPLLGTSPLVTNIIDGWVQLFDNADFSGTVLTVAHAGAGRGKAKIKGDVADLRIIASDNGKLRSFSDRASSIKFQLPVGWTLTLFNNPGFRGASLLLVGTGKIETLENLKKIRPDLLDKVSSLRWHQAP